MRHRISRTIAAAAILGMLVGGVVTASSRASAAKQLKIAALFPGPITDKSWDEAGYNGLVAAGRAIHAKVSYLENVGPADQVADFKSFAAKGYDLVIGHGGEFGSAALQVAPSYPHTDFVVIAAPKGNGTNVASFTVDNAQYGYIEGFVAGKLSRKHHVCGIAGLQGLPAITQQVGTWLLGAKVAHPGTKVTSVYLASMDDIAAARSAATTLASHGCDVIFVDLNAGQSGAVAAAATAHAWTLGFGTLDATTMAPRWVLTNQVYNWTEAYVVAAKLVQAGHFTAGVHLFGYNTAPNSVASLEYSPGRQFNPAVPKKYVKMALQLERKIATGQFHPRATNADAAPGTH